MSGADGVPLRHSARALQSRELVDVSRKDGWRATINEKGKFYIEHGFHPDRPDPSVSTHAPDGRLTSPRSREHTSQQRAIELIEQLRQSGGTIRLDDLDEKTRSEYRRAIHAAKTHHLVPTGFHLLHTGRDKGELVIRLEDDDSSDETDWNRIRLNIRRNITEPSAVFAKLEEDPAGLDIADASIPRALKLIRALAEEAQTRGHRLGVNTKTKHPRLYIQVGKARRAMSLHEEYDQVRRAPTALERLDHLRMPWTKRENYESVPSGRLRLEVNRREWHEPNKWIDTKKVKLEQRLSKIIREIETAFAADEEARI
ncbi:MAG: hypothetical protein J2O49_05180, partial [Sciscionella sp.]|nr:hypothetical protein [Sciscionella sp.]